MRAKHGYIISGGQKASSLIQAGVAANRSDDDGSGYKELVTVQVTTDVDDCEIHVYYPGEDGADEWEIKPINVSSTGGVATITFYSWQIVDPDELEGYNAQAVDADDDNNYVTTVDVYRVYNDPSTQVLFLWDQTGLNCDCSGTVVCPSCLLGAQNGCIVVRDPRLGRFAYQPATWDADTETFTTGTYVQSRDPDRIRLYYQAGWQGERPTCPTRKMDDWWEQTVAYYAASLLDRNVCECSNIQEFIWHWREDLITNLPEKSFQLTFERMNNPFGTTRGAMYARDRCKDPGRRLITA